MEEIKEVNLYIDTSIRGPRRKKGAYGFVLESITEKGPATFTKITKLEESTEHQSLCRAIREAIQRIRKPCRVTVHTQSEYIIAAVNTWIREWERTGWKTKKGTDVTNACLWQEISERKDIELNAISNTTHQYRDWLRAETERTTKQKG